MRRGREERRKVGKFFTLMVSVSTLAFVIAVWSIFYWSVMSADLGRYATARVKELVLTPQIIPLVLLIILVLLAVKLMGIAVEKRATEPFMRIKSHIDMIADGSNKIMEARGGDLIKPVVDSLNELVKKRLSHGKK